VSSPSTKRFCRSFALPVWFPPVEIKGQTYIDGSPERIKAARGLRDRLNPRLDIEVDGGVNKETGRLSAQSGATVLVAGSFVYSHPQGAKAAIQELR